MIGWLSPKFQSYQGNQLAQGSVLERGMSIYSLVWGKLIQTVGLQRPKRRSTNNYEIGKGYSSPKISRKPHLKYHSVAAMRKVTRGFQACNHLLQVHSFKVVLKLPGTVGLASALQRRNKHVPRLLNGVLRLERASAQ